MSEKAECAKCTTHVCRSKDHNLEGPPGCPTRERASIIKDALHEYEKPEIREFARQASIQEFEGYMQLPEGRTARNPRVEEVIQFAKKMGYKKLGVAFCGGLRNEAGILNTILEKRGFKVISAMCKAGSTPREMIGITEEQKPQGPGSYAPMCNSIAQAMILNDAGVEFNILVGLCVGHDSLFIKYAKAPVTVLVAKDRVFGHNAAMGLYLSSSYYRKLLRNEPMD